MKKEEQELKGKEKEKEKSKKNPIKIQKRKNKFFWLLGIISIAGFIGVISESVFAYDLGGYIESFWLLVIGIGLLIQTRWGTLKSIKEGLNKNSTPNLITLILGIITLLASILVFPLIGINNPVFLAIKGITAFIAIIIIIIETWIVRDFSEEE